MKVSNRKFIPAFAAMMAFVLCLFMTVNMAAQSIVSGDVTGTVTDPSGAVVPNATVTLKNLDNNAVTTVKTNATGYYRVPFQRPGRYTVSVTQEGFQTVSQPVVVAVGQSTTSNIKLAVGQSSQTVEVTAQTPIVQTDNGNISTAFDAKAIEAIPNPGGDTSYIAQTAPGVVINTGGGYGNFSAYGLPATSNLFTVNGNDNMDPYLNLNNTGATNLTLGANELQESTVVENGYSGQYGRQAGAQVNYTTKSGSNEFHGNAIYWWNGRAMNANTWFNKADPGTFNGGTPTPGFTPTDRPFVNANQWAGSIGGPIIKNKMFFFFDTEGLRAIIPTSQTVYVPSAAFQNFVLTQGLAAGGATASTPFYQNIFNLYNNAPGAAGAVPATELADATTGDPGGCESAAAVGYNPALGPCVSRFRSTQPNLNREWIMAGRVDLNVTDRDKLYFRYRQDKGVQATYTDPINPVWNAFSTQPQYEGQINYNRTIGNNMVNQLILSGSYYRAIFAPNNLQASLQAFPTTLFFNQITTLGGENNVFPQGRNVTQYQLVDDFSVTKGSHSLKFGANYRRNDITNYTFGVLTSGQAIIGDMASFATGQADLFQQRFPQRQSQPIALYSLGIYAQDQWRITPHFKMDLSLRADHNSNPVCQTNCFNRLADNFGSVTHDVNEPYNQVIQTGLHTAFAETDTLLWQPRIGFAWSPFGNDATVIRGGAGIFYDLFPAVIIDRFARNSPGVNSFNLVGPLSPAEPNNIFTLGQQYNQLFNQGFANGATLASLATASGNAGLIPFNGINFSSVDNSFHTPQFQEWSFEIQQAMGTKSSLTLRYVGNHGIHIPITDPWSNAFCRPGGCAASNTVIPAAPADPRFRQVTNLSSSAVSNYNGFTASLQRKFSQVQFQFNYTWSHAIDEVSNGGVNPFSNDSQIGQIDPTSLRRLNYSNADYDARHAVTMNYMWDPGFKFNNGFLDNTLGGWTVGGTIFWHTGLPYSAYYGNAATSFIGNFPTVAGGGVLTPSFLGGNIPSCERPTRSCLDPTQFAVNAGGGVIDPGATVGNVRRNAFRGPGFFDTDLQLMKNFKLTERWRFGVGATAFNLFNHPNFANPVGDLSSPNFGTIQATVTPPTTPIGAFLPADVSGRIIQLQARITF
jgi:Carboxypeptidase regulatory-like domain